MKIMFIIWALTLNVKKAKTWKAETLKISYFSGFKIKLILLVTIY